MITMWLMLVKLYRKKVTLCRLWKNYSASDC